MLKNLKKDLEVKKKVLPPFLGEIAAQLNNENGSQANNVVFDESSIFLMPYPPFHRSKSLKKIEGEEP